MKNYYMSNLKMFFLLFTFLYGCILTGQISIDNHLLIKEQYATQIDLSNHVDNVKRATLSKDKKSIFYQKNGSSKSITLEFELNSDINTLIISPNEQYIIGFKENESTSKRIYFYDYKGKLLNTIETNIYPKIKFSSNSAFVTILDSFGKSFYVVKNSGEQILFVENYQKFIGNNIAPLYYLDISSDGQYLLIHSHNTFLFSIFSNAFIWKQKIGHINNSLISIEKNKIALKVVSHSNHKKFDLKLFSLVEGNLLQEINNINKIFFQDEKIVFLINDKNYIKYEIQ